MMDNVIWLLMMMAMRERRLSIFHFDPIVTPLPDHFVLQWQTISVARYHGTTAVPFLYGTSTVAFTVLFSTAIPQVPRFFGTVLVRYWHTVTKTALYFDWNCNLRLVFCRSPLNSTRFTYVLYVVLFYSVYQMSEMTSLRQRLVFSVIIYNHGTTEYRGIFPRYLPWRKICGTAQHY